MRASLDVSNPPGYIMTQLDRVTDDNSDITPPPSSPPDTSIRCNNRVLRHTFPYSIEMWDTRLPPFSMDNGTVLFDCELHVLYIYIIPNAQWRGVTQLGVV